MKKYISMIMMAVVALCFTACEPYTDVEAGGTSVEKMAGRWMVKVDMLLPDGTVAAEDIMGGYVEINTYNTAANKATEMWLDDGQNFWDFKLKVDVDYAARTFSSNGEKDNVSYECKLKVEDGAVVEGAGVSPSGVKTDKITFVVSFDDDEEPYAYKYRMTGYRYTGFVEDM